MKIIRIIFLVFLSILFINISYAASIDPLPSWNAGPNKTAIMQFIQDTTNKSNSNYIPPEERIAAFDQDGTLWVEQPIYTEVVYSLDQIKQLAPKHPEWKNQEPYRTILSGNKKAILQLKPNILMQALFATHAGMTVDQFSQSVKQWLSQARDVRWHRHYTELVYQPMLELLNYFRANGYKTYIVTGGGQDFVRAYAQQVYGVPPEQVIGSATQTHFQFHTGQSDLIKTTKLLFNNVFAGKPQDIYLFAGRRPFASFGNSTGDQQMLEYTMRNHHSSLMLLVHHDDGVREYDYGANSKVGTFSNALMNVAIKNKWLVVSMKKDWKKIFSFNQ